MADPHHIAFPLRLTSSGQLATFAQKSRDRVEQDVLTVARTEQGTRTGRDDFGVPDTTFTSGQDPADLERLLEEQVEDALVEVSEVEHPTPLEQVLLVSVSATG